MESFNVIAHLVGEVLFWPYDWNRNSCSLYRYFIKVYISQCCCKIGDITLRYPNKYALTCIKIHISTLPTNCCKIAIKKLCVILHKQLFSAPKYRLIHNWLSNDIVYEITYINGILFLSSAAVGCVDLISAHWYVIN